ncbi:MAG: BioD-like phosphotransacetylase family protein [Halobacteriales archaeon]|jgi:BioD-like phosphotransacetylase family protein
MTKTILTTSLDEGTGKTAITLALATLAEDEDANVGYMKPKGTRLQSSVGKTLDEDPMLAREMLDLDAEMHELEPVVYSPTFIEQALRGREDAEALHDRIVNAFADLSENRDLMMVEGADTVSTGGIVDLTDVKVAEMLEAKTLLVSSYEQPGDVDDVIAAAETLGDDLIGVLFNKVPDQAYDSLEEDAAPYLDGKGIDVLGIVPKEQELAGVTVGDLADELGAEVLTETSMDSYIERFQVGAMSSEEALRYFRRSKDAAVITGGDRAEIQTAALEAPGIRALILSGGHRPSNAVLGKAEEQDVPVLLVQSDTLTAVERAEDVVRGGQTRDEKTVERMSELLHDHADTDAIIGK